MAPTSALTLAPVRRRSVEPRFQKLTRTHPTIDPGNGIQAKIWTCYDNLPAQVCTTYASRSDPNKLLTIVPIARRYLAQNWYYTDDNSKSSS